MALRSLLRYLGVNSGDMQKGIMRIEPNVSVRLVGSQELGTRTEIKNLNSFRVLENSVAFEIERQSERLRQGLAVIQETMGWDETQATTVPQRSKEEAHDYRYFPEPDLPPLVIEDEWIETIRAGLPELPYTKLQRFQEQYGLSDYDANVLVAEQAVADYFEHLFAAAPQATSKIAANWVIGELFSLLNLHGTSIESVNVKPENLAELIQMVVRREISQGTAKTVLAEMFITGKKAAEIVAEQGLQQISDSDLISGLVRSALDEHPEQVATYLGGKDTIARWLFGQVMRAAGGKADPQIVQLELNRQLTALKEDRAPGRE